MRRQILVTYPQFLRIPPTRMREQNEGNGPHVASTAETFATKRAIPIGREYGLERGGGNEESRTKEMQK